MTTFDTTTLPLSTGTWTIDVDHSTVNFSVRHLGLAKVRGRFNEFTGRVEVGETLATSSVSADIALASVDTNNADRDGHLRSGDFFSADTQPTMVFRSTGVVGSDSIYTLAGDLTLGGVTQPVSLEVEFLGTQDYPMDGSFRAGFSATTTISRSDFGIDFDIPLGADKLAIGDKVTIELDVQLIAP